MPFGMQTASAPDFADKIKFDANSGRMFTMNYNPDTREKVPVDITIPPPRFAFDFGTLEIGYGWFSPTGPEYRVVPEGQPLPPQPLDKNDEGRLKFKPIFRARVYGKVLDGLREWSSSANCVLEAVDDLYAEFRAAPEAQQGKIPIVELSKTLPISMGRGTRARTLYAPCFTITGWTDRPAAMGERTVPPPKPAPPVSTKVAFSNADPLDDEIPF